jgi:hypothetical protein
MLELNGKLELIVTDSNSTTGCVRDLLGNGNSIVYYFKLNNKYEIEYIINLTTNKYCYDISYNFKYALRRLLDVDCVLMT